MNNENTETDIDTDTDAISSNKKGGTSEAGVLRGVARSIGRGSTQKGISMMRMPAIGRLPVAGPSPTTAASKIIFRGPNIPTPTVPKVVVPSRVKISTDFSKLPVKQVAKVSDHVSQGISFLDSASDSSSPSTGTTKGKQNILLERILQLKSFASSLIKNTILGITVFEVYGSIVDRFAPMPSISTNNRNSFTDKNSRSTYSQASVSTGIHTLGGFVGGSVHGVVSTLWDAIANATRQRPKNMFSNFNATMLHGLANPALILIRQQLPGMIAHHGLSHAVLFGSYEFSKRQIYSHWTSSIVHDGGDTNNQMVNENVEHMVQLDFLASVALAGGFAGQAQHIASHFTEHQFLMYSKAAWEPLHSRNFLFPLVMSFFPSSIAFIAFECGQNT